jgi:hypothetical protein
MAKPTAGLVNARDPKPPRPPASPKGFIWPEKKQFKNGQYQKFATALQEVLAEKGKTHTELSKLLYGQFDNGVPRSVKGRNWIIAKGVPPDEVQAGYVAQVLDVPMARLLDPKGKFNPAPDMLRRRGGKKSKRKNQKVTAMAPTENAETPKKTKRHYNKRKEVAEDSRWILPQGVPKPIIKLQTSEQHDGLTTFELHAELPPDVAMSIYSMVNSYRIEPPQEGQG